MALNAYLRLVGETQRWIKGSVIESGRQDSIKVIAASHGVVQPMNLIDIIPDGRRQHKAFSITKEVDRATPALYEAWMTNEKILEWELQFWRLNIVGQQEQYYTVLLRNAYVCDIRFEMLNNQYPENAHHPEREHVSFIYEYIQWYWVDGGLSAEDEAWQ